MFDPHAFRDALGSFVTGVTIVTARDGEGRPFGLTANSFNSVSLDPPMVLWSLSLKSRTLPVFRDAQTWAVHVLAADQQDMSDRFATPGESKFDGLAVADAPKARRCSKAMPPASAAARASNTRAATMRSSLAKWSTSTAARRSR